MNDERPRGLLHWQWEGYPLAHSDARNLRIHAITNPIFIAGFVALLVALVRLDLWIALGGVVAMASAMAAQGRGHAKEASAPAPFRGPLDVVSRILAEQLITFPRFVLSGGLARAWRRQR
jgi:hypothetical protein